MWLPCSHIYITLNTIAITKLINCYPSIFCYHLSTDTVPVWLANISKRDKTYWHFNHNSIRSSFDKWIYLSSRFLSKPTKRCFILDSKCCISCWSGRHALFSEPIISGKILFYWPSVIGGHDFFKIYLRCASASIALPCSTVMWPFFLNISSVFLSSCFPFLWHVSIMSAMFSEFGNRMIWPHDQRSELQDSDWNVALQKCD